MLDIRYILLHTATTSAFTTTIIMRLPPLADPKKAAVLPNSAEVRKDLWTYRILFRTWKNRELLPWHYSIGYLHILGKLANWVQLLTFLPKKCISSMIFSYFTRNYAKLDFPKEFCSVGSRWKKATTTTAEEIHLSFFSSRCKRHSWPLNYLTRCCWCKKQHRPIGKYAQWAM